MLPMCNNTSMVALVAVLATLLIGGQVNGDLLR